MKKIIIATQNKHKIQEINEIIKDFGFEAVPRDEVISPNIEIIEDGDTFEDNSYKKAYEIMRLTGEISIADDSGLMVDALNGAPGVYSSRFAGENATDEQNNQKLIAKLADVEASKRTCKYVSVITMVFPNGKTIVARGEVHGHIILNAHGTNGFGYDPYFVPDGYDRTFAEFTLEAKNAISHRANALNELKRQLNACDLDDLCK